jgi:hypothetical protein
MGIAAATKKLIDSVAYQLDSVFTRTPLGEVKPSWVFSLSKTEI